MAKTLQQQIIDGLLAEGEEILHRRKHIVLTCRRCPGEFYYVGKRGALRLGKNLTDSVPVNAKRKQLLTSA